MLSLSRVGLSPGFLPGRERYVSSMAPRAHWPEMQVSKGAVADKLSAQIGRRALGQLGGSPPVCNSSCYKFSMR